MTRAAMSLLADLDKEPSTSRTTTTAPSTSRWSCRRAFPTCWSTAPAASPSAWHQHPAAQPGRGGRRLPGLYRRSRDHPGRAARHRARPDFPTGGEIIGRTGARTALMTGRGSVIMRGQASVEEIRKDREAIIIHSDPLPAEQGRAVERIAELVREKRIEGISDLRDESDRQGMRIVIEMKRDAAGRRDPEPALPVHAAAELVRRQHAGAEPRTAAADGLRDMITAFVDFREEVVVRRTKFELSKSPRPRPCAGGSRHRRRQYRRVHHIIAHPRTRPRPRAPDRQGLAGGRHAAAGRADPGPAHPGHRPEPDPAVGRAGARHPGAHPVAPDRPGREEIFGEATELATAIQGLSRHPGVARAGHADRARGTGRGPGRLRRAAPAPRSSTATPTSRTRT